MRIWLGHALILIGGSAIAATSPDQLIVEPRDVIALEAGTWDAVITTPSRMAGGTPSTATGVQVNELRSGGLWMLNRITVNGGAYEGTGMWGFDARTGRYSGSWADNGTRHIRKDEGSWDPSSRTMTWTSVIEREDGAKVQMRATSTFAGNRRIYRSYAVTPRGEVPLSTVIFIRRPS
jgi:hypothetical protein